MNRTFWRNSGIITTFIGILLVFAQGTGGFVLVGVGLGYLGSSLFSQDNMAEMVERTLTHPERLFFRVFELLSLFFLLTEGYVVVALFALLSLVFIELFYRKKKT